MWSKKILSFQDQGTKNPAWKVDRITHTYFDTKTLMFSCSLIQRDNLCLSEMKSWDQESDIQFSDEKELCEKRITKTIHCPSTEFSACPVSDRNKFSKSTARSWRSNLLVIYIKCERQDLKTWKYFQVCACVLSHFSRAWLFATLWTVACRAPLSMGFSRQEYCTGLPCPPPGNLPSLRIEPVSLTSSALAVTFFTTRATWEAQLTI